MKTRCICGSMMSCEDEWCPVCGLENPDYQYENESIASEEPWEFGPEEESF